MFELMEEYNKLIRRFKMGKLFIENNEENQEAHNLLIKLSQELEAMQTQFEMHNVKVDDNEVWYGFDIEFRKMRLKKYDY